ncbi:hypothetical protein AAMO2058_000567400 [Amorphochlora amoebiformis]
MCHNKSQKEKLILLSLPKPVWSICRQIYQPLTGARYPPTAYVLSSSVNQIGARPRCQTLTVIVKARWLLTDWISRPRLDPFARRGVHHGISDTC